MTSPLTFTHTVTERFLRYLVIDTQSDPASPSCPSTDKQKDLGRLLAAELREMGLSDAHLDEHGYVYATLPANTSKQVPVICFCSHMDTSPDCSGANVKPQIVRNYQGGDITLPADPSQVIRFAEHPALRNQIGHDIITCTASMISARPALLSAPSSVVPSVVMMSWPIWLRSAGCSAKRITCEGSAGRVMSPPW